MRRSDLTAIVLACAASLPTPAAHAQIPTNAPGSVRGVLGDDGIVNPARTTQQVSVWTDLSGGFTRDENRSEITGTTIAQGPAFTTLGAFRYWRGRSNRSLETNARLFQDTQRARDLTSRGGEVTVQGQALRGQRVGLNFSARAANDSASIIGRALPSTSLPAADGSVPPALNIPDVSPQQGVLSDRWYTLGASAGAYRNWAPRHRTTLQLFSMVRRPSGGNAPRLSSAQEAVDLRYDWMHSARTGLLLSYRVENLSQSLPGDASDGDARTQAIEGGIQWRRDYSPVRRLSASLRAGATHVLASPFPGVTGSVEPTGSASATYGLTNRVTFSATGGRSVLVLPLVSEHAFASNTVTLSTSSVLVSRVTLTLSGSAARGTAIAAAPVAFDTANGSAALRYTFRYGSVFTGVTRYHHRLNGVTAAGLTVPQYDQTSVRAGLTLWLPIFGAF